MLIEESARVGVPEHAGTVTTTEVYDFGRPATLSRENARTLEASFESFSRQWSSLLSGRIRTRVHATVEVVTMQTYEEYAQSLATTTAMVVCGLPDTDDRVIVQFPLSAALSWIIQMVGGTAIDPPEERALTLIEQALIRSVMVDTIEHLSNALTGMLPAGMSFVGIQYNSQFAQVAAAADLVIVARFTLRLADRTVPASVMLPAAVVLAGFSVPGTEHDADAPALLRAQLERTRVELALRLAPRTVDSDQILGLAVGDVLPLPHAADRPLNLVLGDLPVASGAVGTSGARMACVITAATLDTAHKESV